MSRNMKWMQLIVGTGVEELVYIQWADGLLTFWASG